MVSWGRVKVVMMGTKTPRTTATPVSRQAAAMGSFKRASLCDDGNSEDTDECTGNCAPAVCGDGVVWFGREACDDGNSDATDSCTSSCQSAICGDGILRRDLTPEEDAYEECDDGNQVAQDGCSERCLSEVCGNGRVDAGEDCDDGNATDTDQCTSGCVEALAAMGFGLGQEACDDGNQDSAMVATINAAAKCVGMVASIKVRLVMTVTR